MGLLGSPNIEKLIEKRDVAGLIRAVSYMKDINVRKRAASALGIIGDAGAVGSLSAAMNVNDERVRLEAIVALGKIGDAGAVELLISALNYLDKDVPKRAAEEALIKIYKSGNIDNDMKNKIHAVFLRNSK